MGPPSGDPDTFLAIRHIRQLVSDDTGQNLKRKRDAEVLIQFTEMYKRVKVEAAAHFEKSQEDIKVMEQLQAQAAPNRFLRVSSFKSNPAAIRLLTSFPDYEIFKKFTEVLCGRGGGFTPRDLEGDMGGTGKAPILGYEDRVFVLLVFLRQGLTFAALGSFFGVSDNVASKIVRS